jgi:cupin 2 domain-containing protein
MTRPPLANLFGDLLGDRPESAPRPPAPESVQELLSTPGVRIERIVSFGHASPPDFWYDQDEREWVLLLTGAARVAFEDRTVALAPGDMLDIAAHERHRVEWTTPDEPTVWLAVFLE